MQEVASRLGLHHGSLRLYGLNSDVNSVLLMADIVLYDSSQNVQGFPPLLMRAMAFGIPVIAPDFPVLKKYVSSNNPSKFFLCCCKTGMVDFPFFSIFVKVIHCR